MKKYLIALVITSLFNFKGFSQTANNGAFNDF